MKQGLLLIFCFSLSVMAEEKTALAPTDFAYGFEVNVAGQDSIYKLSLPDEIYATALQGDLADVRVFNRQNSPVPHQVRHKPLQKVTRDAVSLPFFPVAEMQKDKLQRLKVITNEHGAIVNIGQQEKTATQVTAYLIDVSQLKESPSALRFTWDEAISQRFVRKVRIEASDDLLRWHNVTGSGTLASLTYAGQQLVQREIKLSGRRAKYFRLRWSGKLEHWPLQKIEALFEPEERNDSRRWRTVTGQHIENNNIFEFDTAGWWPVDRLRVAMPEKNTVARIVLSSRSGAKDNWQERYRGMLFDLKIEGKQVQNGDIPLRLVKDRYWRLELLGDARIGNSASPLIKFGWIPYQLIFVAQGEAPYTLAFGSSTVSQGVSNVQGLMQQLVTGQDQLVFSAATLGRRHQLGGPAKLVMPLTPVNWKIWLLWALLLVGVMLLAWMAMNLYRQMNVQSD